MTQNRIEPHISFNITKEEYAYFFEVFKKYIPNTTVWDTLPQEFKMNIESTKMVLVEKGEGDGIRSGEVVNYEE